MGASAGSEVGLISSAQHNRQFKNPASKTSHHSSSLTFVQELSPSFFAGFEPYTI
jgi:hypothetical protein